MNPKCWIGVCMYDALILFFWNIKTVLEKLDPVEAEDPKLAYDDGEEYYDGSRKNSLRTPR